MEPHLLHCLQQVYKYLYTQTCVSHGQEVEDSSLFGNDNMLIVMSTDISETLLP